VCNKAEHGAQVSVYKKKSPMIFIFFRSSSTLGRLLRRGWQAGEPGKPFPSKPRPEILGVFLCHAL